MNINASDPAAAAASAGRLRVVRPAGPDLPVTEPALAADIRAGDVLLVDGLLYSVVAELDWSHYHEGYQTVYGAVISCRRGSTRLYLYRLGNALVSRVARVRAGGAR